MAVSIALFGCSGDNDDNAADDGGNTPTDNVENDPPADDQATNNQAPVWSAIPAQTWTVGVAVHIDLSDYVTDADGDTLTITLDSALPDGVTLNGSVISGTPTTATDPASYLATADDGNG